jgi:sterol desaturase/sphingolipid hydroxylase (fatty acid hydroxylase superfamily)
MDLIYDFFYYYCLFNFTYYVSNLVLFVLDVTGLLSGQKLQPYDRSNIIQTYKKCLPVALLNTFIYNIPGIFTMLPMINWYGFKFSWAKTLFDLAMAYLLMDILYWATHRLLHTKYFYNRYHKFHHEIISPVGISATYLTLLDFYSNIFSIYFPLIMLSSDATTTSLWMIISTLNTIFIGHCGYGPIASFHDNHHLHFNCNYGVGIWADKLCGTVWKEPKRYGPT